MLTALALTAVAESVQAQESQPSVIKIHLVDDSEAQFEINDVRRIDFADDKLNVSMNSGEGNGFSLDEVRKVTFADGGTSFIGSAVSSESGAKLTVSPNPATDLISISGCENTPCKVMIYSTDGRLKATAAWDGTSSVSVAGLPAGLYILRAAGKQAKFIKK